MSPRSPFEPTLSELADFRRAWEPPSDPATLARRRAWAAWSNAGIEGNPVSWPDAEALLTGGDHGTGDRGEREILGCHAALAFLDDFAAADLSPVLLRQLHALLMTGLGREAGGYRKGEVRIVRESGPDRGEVVFQPPHPTRVPGLLEELLDGLARQLAAGEEVFLVAGRFHYEFQSIHPFEDGNGRVGRLLTTLIAREGWPSRGFHTAPAMARAGAGYYLALRAVRPDYESRVEDGLRPWLVPFLDMMRDALLHPDPERC